MHELSIALSIVDMATEEAESRGASRVSAVHLKPGLLSGVVKEALLSSYALACQGTPLDGSELLIEETVATAFCSRCAAERPLPSLQWFHCPVCEAPSSDVVRGKELEVVAFRQNVLKKNDVAARALRQSFHDAGVFVVSLVSSPGSGKTALLEKTLSVLVKHQVRAAALVRDLATENDAARLARSHAPVRKIIT